MCFETHSATESTGGQGQTISKTFPKPRARKSKAKSKAKLKSKPKSSRRKLASV